MPYDSLRQARWAHATDQPFARRWDKITDFSKLPKYVQRRRKAAEVCTCKATGAPGEKIAPGVTRIRGNLCNVHGKYGPCDAGASGGAGKPKKPAKGRKPAKPKQTPEQRAQARQQQRQANVDAVKKRMADTDTGLAPGGVEALTAFAEGTPPTGLMAEGLAKMGLAERAEDGTYRMTPTGRAAVSAMQAGDYQRAVDTISRGSDQESARQGRQAAATSRQQAAAQRRADVEARRQQRAAERAQAAAKKPDKAGSGGKKKPEKAEPVKAGAKPPSKRTGRGSASGATPSAGGSSGARPKPKPKPVAQPEKAEPQVAPALQTAAQQLSEGAEVSEADQQALIRNGLARIVKGELILTAAGQRLTKKEFVVFKDASGGDRWLLVSSTAYRDRDKEIVSTTALKGAVAQADASGMRGPLRFWHVPGLDLGDCDYQATAQDGRFLIESGTFRSPALATAVKAHADEYQVSIGFIHPATEPDADGVYKNITIFERSLVPKGRAANPLTRVVITKELRMLTPEKEAQLKSLTEGDPTLLADLLSRVTATDKAAQESGATYKDDLRALIREELVSLLGQTEKAAEVAPPDDPPVETKADMMAEVADDAGEVVEEVAEETGDYLGDMSTDEFRALLSEAFAAALAPLVKSLDIAGKMAGHMDELKGMMGGYTATKDAALAEVKETITAVQAQVADLSGSQPRILAGGFRASQSPATITTDETKIKDTGPSADPKAAAFGAFMQDLGFSGPVQGA